MDEILCRACMAPQGKIKHSSIFSENGKIAKEIFKLTRLVIIDLGELKCPAVICQRCLMDLERAISFRELVIKSDGQFKEISSSKFDHVLEKFYKKLKNEERLQKLGENFREKLSKWSKNQTKVEEKTDKKSEDLVSIVKEEKFEFECVKNKAESEKVEDKNSEEYNEKIIEKPVKVRQKITKMREIPPNLDENSEISAENFTNFYKNSSNLQKESEEYEEDIQGYEPKDYQKLEKLIKKEENSHEFLQNSDGFPQNSANVFRIGENVEEFGQSPENFGQNSGIVGQIPENFGQNSENFGHNPENFGQKPEVFSHNLENFGHNLEIFGQNPEKFGHNPEDYYQNYQYYLPNPKNSYQIDHLPSHNLQITNIQKSQKNVTEISFQESSQPKKRKSVPQIPSETATNKLQCKICSKKFSKKCYLTQHFQTIHMDFKPHKCIKCGKRYATLEDLKHHEEKHVADKPFKCQICEKSFIHKADLKRHAISHLDDKPFQCEFCPRGFVRNDHLAKHLRVHQRKMSKAEKFVKGFGGKSKKKSREVIEMLC